MRRFRRELHLICSRLSMTRRSELSSRQRRMALGVLPRERLAQITTLYDLGVADRRVVAQHVDAIVRARRVDFGAVLDLLSRDELKTVCEALGLDASGRAKRALIGRILGRDARATAERGTTLDQPTAKKPAPERAHIGPEARSTLDPDAMLSREQLERHLWSAADILRGSIDSSDYKGFIFGLLFLKRLSDRFGEECEQLVAEGADPEDADEHQFYVPPTARWDEIRKAPSGLGEVLNIAASALEDANSQALEGVLAGIDFNDERRLGDAKQRDDLLSRLLIHFSQLNLRNDHLSEPDMLGRAYEYLIEKFADDAGKKGGEFYTPHMVVRLLVELLEPGEGMRICDPTCGSGGMLIQAGKYIVEHGGQPRNFSLYGQEKNLGTWAICKMNMLLHGYPDARIEKGDTIRDPKLLQDGELMLFDRVIANPPFSLDAWGHEVAAGDGHGRFRFGVPPKSKGDLAFVQHMIASLSACGKMAVVMPHGVLFRTGAEQRIREGLVSEGLLEAVIGLPANVFYGTGIPTVILLIGRDKDGAKRGSVLFVDASRDYGASINQNVLRVQDVSKIVAAVREFKERAGYASRVPIDRIVDHGFNLNVSRYVGNGGDSGEAPDLASAISRLRCAEAERDASARSLDRILGALGYEK